jgi:hypothetical protein
MACTRGYRSGEPARSQAVLAAFIALNSATDMWHPLRGRQRVTAGVTDRPLHAGEISAEDVGSGSKAVGWATEGD